MKGFLALEDGTVFRGESVGADGFAFGEAVFTTAMTGYQEIVTDPSFAEQIVAFTAPCDWRLNRRGRSSCMTSFNRSRIRFTRSGSSEASLPCSSCIVWRMRSGIAVRNCSARSRQKARSPEAAPASCHARSAAAT